MDIGKVAGMNAINASPSNKLGVATNKVNANAQQALAGIDTSPLTLPRDNTYVDVWIPQGHHSQEEGVPPENPANESMKGVLSNMNQLSKDLN